VIKSQVKVTLSRIINGGKGLCFDSFVTVARLSLYPRYTRKIAPSLAEATIVT
jgi:hypothetical protein